MLPGDFVRRGVFAGKFGKSKQLSSTYPNFFNFSDFPNTTFPIFSTKAKIPRESYHLGIFNSRRVIFTGYNYSGSSDVLMKNTSGLGQSP